MKNLIFQLVNPQGGKMLNKNIFEFPIVYTGNIPNIALGWGAHETIGDECDYRGMKKVLIVTSGLKGTGIVDEINGIIQRKGISTEVFDRITSNPKHLEIMEAYNVFSGESCDGIVAVGGGSSIDAGKCIRVMAANGGRDLMNFTAKIDPPWMQTLKGINPCTVPQISVATTAGTGAEVSSWATVSNTENRSKVLVGAPNIHSVLSIVDPLLVRLQPADMAAKTGFDAMSHCFEAFLSKVESPYSYGLIMRSIELICRNIRDFTYNRMNSRACESMCWASTAAGMAIALGSGAGIVHGLGHQISALKDCHHGHVNGVLTLGCERYNLPSAVDKFARMTEAMGVDTTGMTQGEKAERWFYEMEDLLKDLNIIPGHLREQFGLTEEDISHITDIYKNDFCRQGNPREFVEQEVRGLLTGLLDSDSWALFPE